MRKNGIHRSQLSEQDVCDLMIAMTRGVILEKRENNLKPLYSSDPAISRGTVPLVCSIGK
jgi:hypothetical protein